MKYGTCVLCHHKMLEKSVIYEISVVFLIVPMNEISEVSLMLSMYEIL